ncbi:MAG: prolipoprotein diacylglyceryl transferase [Lachnospiraceae bacterium]|nr:prolipoprotein diacylglyceryl transferase [Lachnospiraceae bacterium]
MPAIMNPGDIAFPHLGIYLTDVPKDFKVFGYTITLYAVIITVGVLLAVRLCEEIAKRTGKDGEIYWDIYLPLVLLSVLCARIYYVVFSWDYYRNDPIRVFYIHQGGLAIYGGVLGGLLVLYVISRIKKRPYLELTDTVLCGVLLGQILGRWGNFTNREAFGQYTDSLFAMRLPIEAVRSHEISDSIAAHLTEGTNYIQVHPTCFYESCWNLVLLTLMLLYVKHKRFEGEMTLIYLGGYGLGRAIIESLRTDQLKLPGTELPVSQLLGICLLVFALTAEIIVRARLRAAGRKSADPEG